MPDLKAAAKRLRDTAKRRIGEIQFFVGMEQSEKRIAAEADDYILAAQTLEAWAWQEEKGAVTKRWGKSWRCCYYDGDGELVRFDADTPLGAVLAAMEGETDGN